MSMNQDEFLFLDQLRLDEMVIEISAKSNYIFHLAADKSKITLKKFDIAPFSGYKSELTNELANHYLYQIIRQVGWFIGGLEAFGSPGNFIRGLSAGVIDFLTLPVRGIQNGAFGVLRGAADGTKSLVRNASFSFISSITNIADSLASNTELLALDGLANDSSKNYSEGLFSSVNGQLRFLGMTVLGSVAGVVQHPINAALEDNSDSALLKSSKVAFAAGRGIAGLVLQPVGGLSKVIAKTGSSLLGKTQAVDKSRKLIFKKKISTSLIARALDIKILNSERCRLRVVGRNGWILMSREEIFILLDGENGLYAKYLIEEIEASRASESEESGLLILSRSSTASRATSRVQDYLNQQLSTQECTAKKQSELPELELYISKSSIDSLLVFIGILKAQAASLGFKVI
ncbi:unnamed protein product [Oikopleura dioica]|uniref:Uncharacterized protein n=1 Tax=Oikopleura dioica TaxID=34765 RepID=E4XRT1_OIKDI|nr:unnamed protein product [Oikopleura dioica]CBY33114.1 unnamed protein product [Oikopleura dioica]